MGGAPGLRQASSAFVAFFDLRAIEHQPYGISGVTDHPSNATEQPRDLPENDPQPRDVEQMDVSPGPVREADRSDGLPDEVSDLAGRRIVWR